MRAKTAVQYLIHRCMVHISYENGLLIKEILYKMMFCTNNSLPISIAKENGNYNLFKLESFAHGYLKYSVENTAHQRVFDCKR